MKQSNWLAVNLAEVKYIDSSGIASLLEVSRGRGTRKEI